MGVVVGSSPILVRVNRTVSFPRQVAFVWTSEPKGRTGGQGLSISAMASMQIVCPNKNVSHRVRTVNVTSDTSKTSRSPRVKNRVSPFCVTGGGIAASTIRSRDDQLGIFGGYGAGILVRTRMSVGTRQPRNVGGSPRSTIKIQGSRL